MWFSLGIIKHLILVVILSSIQAWAKVPKANFLKEDLSSLRQTDVDREGRPWRLPNTTYPLKYHLHITTWIHQEIDKFTGNVTIELLVKESTSELVLHAKGLKIQKIFAQDLDTKQTIEYLKSRIIDDLLIIDTTGTKQHFVFTQKQRLRLEIHYTGIIDNSGEGFSKMSYDDEKNNKIYGAYTQMEPLSAREVLPCYDEPALKANFTVHITHGSNYTAISNMPVKSSVENETDNMITTSFMETPPMSTYLLAFVISNYKFVARESNGITQRVFLPPNFENTGNMALTNGIKVLELLTQYMDVPYALPKLDHISIREYRYGGMENWGLITYHESSFVQDNSSSFGTEINVENHEIAHQWFGNLVSPEWWNSIWLNEGFATYYSHVLMKKLNPEYPIMENFIQSTCGEILYIVPMSVADYLEKPGDIYGQIGLSSYGKAPCIIQMFDHAFEEPVFRKGVSNYLKERAFSIANENHLYDHLQAALLESSHRAWNYSVHEIMRTWLHAKTLPIVTIARDYNNSNIIHIQQKPSMSDVNELWWIPMNFATAAQPNSENTKAIYYMPPISGVTLNLTEFNITLNADDWLLANIQNTGLYKVDYDKENMLRLEKAFNTNYSVIPKLNRVQILRSIPTVWKDQLSAISSLEMLKYLPHEKDSIVWIEIIGVLKTLQSFLCPSALCELYNDFVRDLVKPQYLKYYKTPEKELSYAASIMRRNLIELACDLDVPECIEQRKSLYEAQKGNLFKGKSFDFAISCSAAEFFNNTEFDDAIKMLKKAPKQQESINFWHSLLCTRNQNQYEQVLKVSADYLKGNVIKSRSTRKTLLRDWANLLKENTKEWKWNSTYSFLKKLLPEFKRLPEAGSELCKDMASVAKEIKKPFQEKYIELMKLCTKQLLMSGTIEESSEIMPNISDIGANYAFENNPIWQLELQKIHSWLKEQNSN